MLDLQQFCGDEEDCRPYLAKPWSEGEYTYATNGHILVRVPRRPDVAESPENPITAEKVERVIGVAPNDVWRAPVIVALPPLEETECEECDGMGSGCHCSTCQCECRQCDGTGRRNSDAGKSARYGRVPFALKYVRKICALPALEICDQSAPDAPLRFRFDGGVGSLMALRSDKHLERVEVFADAPNNPPQEKQQSE